MRYFISILFISMFLYSCNGAEINVMGIYKKRIEPGAVKTRTDGTATETTEIRGKYDGKYMTGGSISGYIVNEQNIPLGNALVSFIRDDEEFWTSMNCNDSAYFEIKNLQPGIYNFVFLAPEYYQEILMDVGISVETNAQNEKLKIVLKK